LSSHQFLALKTTLVSVAVTGNYQKGFAINLIFIELLEYISLFMYKFTRELFLFLLFVVNSITAQNIRRQNTPSVLDISRGVSQRSTLLTARFILKKTEAILI